MVKTNVDGKYLKEQVEKGTNLQGQREAYQAKIGSFKINKWFAYQ